MPVCSFTFLCSLGFNILSFAIFFCPNDSGSHRCVQGQQLLLSVLHRAGVLRLFMIVINKHNQNKYPQEECILAGKLCTTSFIFFFF